MITRANILDLLAALGASFVVLAGLAYAYIVYEYNVTTLVVSVLLPLVIGSGILARRSRILLFSFLALFWAIIDDSPVFFDSVLTWPQVTRFHPFLPRLYMNIVIHALTLLFLYLALREGMKGKSVSRAKEIAVALLGLVVFGLAYAQNIPLAAIQNAVESSWYAFDVAEKVLSIGVLAIAVHIAKR